MSGLNSTGVLILFAPTVANMKFGFVPSLLTTIQAAINLVNVILAFYYDVWMKMSAETANGNDTFKMKLWVYGIVDPAENHIFNYKRTFDFKLFSKEQLPLTLVLLRCSMVFLTIISIASFFCGLNSLGLSSQSSNKRQERLSFYLSSRLFLLICGIVSVGISFLGSYMSSTNFINWVPEKDFVRISQGSIKYDYKVGDCIHRLRVLGVVLVIVYLMNHVFVKYK